MAVNELKHFLERSSFYLKALMMNFVTFTRRASKLNNFALEISIT